jgi:hypothetical protein
MIKIFFSVFILLVNMILTGCTPKVQLEAPSRPIIINLNVKVEHELKVQMSKDVKDVFKKNPNLF